MAYGELKKEDLKKTLLNNTTKDVKIYSDADYYVVTLDDKFFKVDLNGKVEVADEGILQIDGTPGDITKDENGNSLSGTEANPYKVMSIEDLMTLSQLTNSGDTLNNKYITLGRNLDFKAELSYSNYETTDYNEYLGITDDVGLMEALTNEDYNGFVPNKDYSYGTFDGNNKIIRNLYIKKDGDAGFFIHKNYKRFLIKDLEITGKIICNGNSCGTFMTIGSTFKQITNCISRVDIIATGNNIGGISYNVPCTSCKNYGNITGNNTIGGIMSSMNSCMDCENYGNITGNNYVGGITGGQRYYKKL